MPFDRDSDARQDIKNQQQQAKQIADAQMQKTGFSRTPGFTPAPRAQHPYQPEAERPQPLAPSGPVQFDESKQNTTRRSFGVNQGDQ